MEKAAVMRPRCRCCRFVCVVCLTLAIPAKDSAKMFGVTDRQMRRILSQWEYIGAVTEGERGRYILEAHP